MYAPALGLLAETLVGASARRRRLEAEAHVRRAAEVAQARAREHAAEQRLGIARELHDVLAHTISVIAVQGGVALDALDDSPEVTRQALTTMRTSTRQAIAELQAALHLLRAEPAGTWAAGTAVAAGAAVPADAVADATADVDGSASETELPQPGLARLPDLVGAARAAGVRVVLRVDPVEGVLPPLVELTAYRIVQEALTNVARHAGAGSAAEVRVSRAGADLLVSVEDDGAGTGGAATVPGNGFGLRGMRERAALVGGTVSAGPTPGGGFEVLARLPVPDRPAVPEDGAGGGPGR